MGLSAAVLFAQGAALTDLAGITLTTKRVERSAEATTTGPRLDLLYLAVDGIGLPMRTTDTTGRAGKSADG